MGSGLPLALSLSDPWPYTCIYCGGSSKVRLTINIWFNLRKWSISTVRPSVTACNNEWHKWLVGCRDSTVSCRIEWLCKNPLSHKSNAVCMSTTLMKISTTKKHMYCTWLFIRTCFPFYQNTSAPAKHKMQVDSCTIRRSWNLSSNPIPKRTLPATILAHLFLMSKL